MSGKSKPQSSAAPCGCWRCILYIFSPQLNQGVFCVCVCVCLLMLASCPPSTRRPMFRATVGETAVVQLRTWPLRLIIYSLRCRAAGRLCSLLLVFPRSSSHLSHLNKTVSLQEALSCNRAEDPRANLRTAAAGRGDQTPPRSQHSANPVKSNIHSNMAVREVWEFKRVPCNVKQVEDKLLLSCHLAHGRLVKCD